VNIPNATGKRITVVTAGHVSACPRMLKAADALTCAGYRVHVVSVNNTAWMTAADDAVKATRRWTWSVVDYDAVTGSELRWKTGARFKAMQAIAKALGPERAPIGVAIRAYSRAHDEIVRAVTAEPADFIYGGSTGALAAVACAAAALGVPYGIDFEDFHSGEGSGPGSDLPNALAARVERHVIPGARFITAGSPMIAETYADRYDTRPLPIHNTFSIAPEPAEDHGEGPLRLYWFSQTLGPTRGLEDVIRAAGEARLTGELHLRARPIPEYLDPFRRLHASVAPDLKLVIHQPASPDEMVKLAQPYDVAFSGEEPSTFNRQLALGNKIFTYLAAGVPVVLSRTPAQSRLELDLGDAAFGYDSGDVHGLARVLRRLTNDVAARRQARAAARAAATRRWHWEHPEDRGALLAAVGAAL
jgi:glycosyltransferase involved in cell wall biosynthesis